MTGRGTGSTIFGRTIDQFAPAFVVDANSKHASSAIGSRPSLQLRSTHPVEGSRKKTDETLCSLWSSLGVMSLQRAPPSVVQKSFCFVAAQPTLGVRSFMDSILPSCCALAAMPKQIVNRSERTERARFTRIEFS